MLQGSWAELDETVQVDAGHEQTSRAEMRVEGVVTGNQSLEWGTWDSETGARKTLRVELQSGSGNRTHLVLCHAHWLSFALTEDRTGPRSYQSQS